MSRSASYASSELNLAFSILSPEAKVYTCTVLQRKTYELSLGSLGWLYSRSSHPAASASLSASPPTTSSRSSSSMFFRHAADASTSLNLKSPAELGFPLVPEVTIWRTLPLGAITLSAWKCVKACSSSSWLVK
eukprot:422443-Prorocentrum_minimum.AAC.1